MDYDVGFLAYQSVVELEVDQMFSESGNFLSVSLQKDCRSRCYTLLERLNR
jgi:hypothetical protein